MWLVAPLFPRWDLGHPSQRNELEDKGCFHGAQAAQQTWEVRGRAAAGGPLSRPPGEVANRLGGAQASWGSNGVRPRPSLPLWIFSNHTLNKDRAEYREAMGKYFVNATEHVLKKGFLKKGILRIKVK